MAEDINKPEFVFRTNMTPDNSYVQWLADVKSRYITAQAKASLHVNSELLEFYWSLGRDLATMN